MGSRPEAPAAGHPLDPLTPEEIRAAAAAILEAHPELGEPRFPLLTLDEPPKGLVHAWRPADPIPRRAFAVVFDAARGATFEAQVDLSAGARVDAWTPMPGVQPSILLEEVFALQDIV